MSCSCCGDPKPMSFKSDCALDCARTQGLQASKESEGMTFKKIISLRFSISALFFVLGLSLDFFLNPGFAGLAGLSFSTRVEQGWIALLPVFFFIASHLISGYTVLWAAIKNSLARNFFDENFLMSIATIGAFIIGQWAEAAAVMLFYNLGEIIQEAAVYRSKKSITDLLDLRPSTARLAKDDAIVPADSLSIGSIIRVLPGEKVPLDGIVIEGSSFFDTAALTGESMPREALPDTEALAGFVNGQGTLLIKTTREYSQTAASKMLDLIEKAQGRKARSEKLITRFSKVYTPLVTYLALALAILPPVFFSLARGTPITGWAEFAPWVQRALVFLVISCPCAFVISVPLGFFGGIGGAAKKGILVKGADTFDALAKARTVIFDKTGTLTEGRFKVRNLELASNVVGTPAMPGQMVGTPAMPESSLESFVIHLAYCAEKNSTHPLALAIISWIQERDFVLDSSSMQGFKEMPGLGISMEFEGRRALVGSRTLLTQEAVTGVPAPSKYSSVDIAYDGRWLGRFLLSDEPKDDARKAMQSLRQLGVKNIVMLTGDHEAAARAVASELEITDVRSGVLPHQKVEHYESISTEKNGSTLFIGDGINDAAVLARADVGLAMGALGSDVAIEAADVVLMNDSPLLVAEAIKTARWTHRIVGQNIALAFIVKIGFLVLGAFGLASLWEAVFADVGVALLATLNAVRSRKS